MSGVLLLVVLIVVALLVRRHLDPYYFRTEVEEHEFWQTMKRESPDAYKRLRLLNAVRGQ